MFLHRNTRAPVPTVVVRIRAAPTARLATCHRRMAAPAFDEAPKRKLRVVAPSRLSRYVFTVQAKPDTVEELIAYQRLKIAAAFDAPGRRLDSAHVDWVLQQVV